MNYSDFDRLEKTGVDFGYDSELSVSDYQGHCAVDGFIAMQLTSTSPMYSRNEVFDIVIDSKKDVLAFLVTCADQYFTYQEASAIIFSAYLNEVQESDVVGSDNEPRRDYIFKNDFVVLHHDKINDYNENYRRGSALWGMFTHIEDQLNKNSLYKTPNNKIVAKRKLSVETPSEQDAVWRSVAHLSPLERYLKLYHLLEIRFDLELVDAIKALNSDLKGIGKILNSYSGDKEFDRLLKITKQYCKEIDFFDKILKEAFSNKNHINKWKEILVEYSKESNPYKDERAEKFKEVLDQGFSEQAMKYKNLTWNYDHLTKLTVYMIYRVRSSIAHFRLGEFLLSTDDEAFVAEVAEPLLRGVVSIVYSRA